jgi:POTRA domain, FtsQ-type/Cell division protein FtsQ
MASGRKRQLKRQVEEEPAKPEPEEVEVEEEEGEQEDEAPEVEEDGEPEDEPRPRRTAKTRAPKRSAAAPVPRQKAARKEAPRRQDPRQPSLFSRLAEERVSRTAARTGGSILLSALAISGLVVLFYLFAGSRFFALKGVDVVWPAAESGVAPLLSAGEVEETVRILPTIARGVLKADLEMIREKLKENPLIREVEVARLLPDRLRVSVIERRPVALALKGDINARGRDRSVVCVDDDGVMFGDSSHWRGKPWPPLISGLAEDGSEDAKKKNHGWIVMYKRLIAELDQTEPPLSSRIDEIHFDEDTGARLRLKDKHEAVLVGKEDFRTKLNVALDILAAVNSGDLDKLNLLRIGDAERLLNGKINYLNVNDPKRPVVGLDE